MVEISQFLALILLIALVSVSFLYVSSKWRYAIMAGIFMVMGYLTYWNWTAEELGSFSIFPPGEVFIAFSFWGDPYSRIMVFGFTLMGILALLYGIKGAKAIEQMVAVWALVCAMGVSFANDFITLVLFWELLTLTTAWLIFLNNTREAFFMAYRFLYFHLTGGLLILAGIVQHCVATGSTVLTEPEVGLPFFVLGVGFKAAFIPFHLWVAWGYPAASLFSSVLLAGLTTKIGVYGVARILPSHEGIVLMGGIMSLVGVGCALAQKNMRKLLSYHIVSQIGYMIAGVGLGSTLAVDGGFFHLLNNVMYKSLLFMAAGAVFYCTGSEDLHDLPHHEEEEEGEKGGGAPSPLWKAMPLVTIGAVVGAMSIAGAPLFNGYVSKYMLKEAMYGAGPAEWMLLLASVGTTISFCKFVYFGFFKARAPLKKLPQLPMQLSILGVSFLCLLLGIRPGLISEVLPYGSMLEVYSWSGVYSGLQPVVAGVIIFALMAKPLYRGLPIPSWFCIEALLSPVIDAVTSRVQLVFGRLLEVADRNRKNINVDQLLLGTVMIIVLIMLFYFGVFRGF